jgi:uncharacterized linocin/CFP29 family protein
MGDNVQVQSPQSFMNGLAANAMQRFMNSGLKVNSLRTNSLLRKDEWIELDRRIVDIARSRLTGIMDLQSKGLTLPLGGLGTLISQYEAQSDMSEANIDMAGVSPGQEDDVAFDLRSVPVPIVHKDFRINIRRLLASRKLGDGLDTTQGEVAARKVSDMNERMLFRGAGITVDGQTIYGYTTHPDRNTGACTGPWSVIANIYADVLSMIKDAHADRMYGPYILYVAGDVWPDLLNVYDDGSGQTARDRLLRIPGLEDVKPADELADGNIVLVQMTRDVVDLAVAQEIVTVDWETMGGMQSHFKIMSAMVPRLKSDSKKQMGVVHYTGASV